MGSLSGMSGLVGAGSMGGLGLLGAMRMGGLGGIGGIGMGMGMGMGLGGMNPLLIQQQLLALQAAQARAMQQQQQMAINRGAGDTKAGGSNFSDRMTTQLQTQTNLNSQQQSTQRSGNQPNCSLVMHNMITENMVTDAVEYRECLEDITIECEKFGEIRGKVVIPKTGLDRCKVFVTFAEISSAVAAKQALHGRSFGGNNVVVVFGDVASA